MTAAVGVAESSGSAWPAPSRQTASAGSAGAVTEGVPGPFSADPVSRDGLGSLQRHLMPEPILRSGHTSFGGAEFDFKCAPCVRRALAAFAENGYFGFTVIDDDYRGRVEWWMAHAREWEMSGAWLVPTLGTIFSVATCLRMLVGPDDAMIVQPPVYYRYEQAATRLGLHCVHNPLVERDGRYEMDLEGLERLMADRRNRLLVICNPANPVGRVWERDVLERVSELSARYGTVVLSDEIFGEVTFGGRRTVPYASLEAGRANAIALISIGKSFGCTGLNFANAIIPCERLRARFEAQRTRDHFGSVDPFGRCAMMAAYTPEGLAWQRASLDYIWENYEMVRSGIEAAAPGSRVYGLEGTFVSWVRWGGLDVPGGDVARFLAEDALIEAEPGEEYGREGAGCSRINLAALHAETSAAMGRLREAVRARGSARGASRSMQPGLGGDA